MASRLFCSGLLQQIKFAQSNKLLSQKYLDKVFLVAGKRALLPLCHAQLLHEKVYDKDSNFGRQRELNKYVKNDFESNEEKTPTFTRRGRHKQQMELETPEVQELTRNHNKKTVTQTLEDEVEDIDDPDNFGGAKTYQEDEGDLMEDEFIQNPVSSRRKLSQIQYARLIKDHLNTNRLKDAIDVLEVRMLKEDRVKPDNYIYNLLISGCAKAGYTRKAFNLFTRMRQRALKVTGGTYTSLFNACANASSKNYGLELANNLRETMLEKSIKPNVKNYNAMIKAYGRCGDVKTAYLLADEMLEQNLNVGTETFNFLLQACASDSEFGFRHGLLTWHKMLQRGIKPDYYSFTLMLRCVRDCQFGDLETMQQVLKQILEERRMLNINSKPKKMLSSPENATCEKSEIDQIDSKNKVIQIVANKADEKEQTEDGAHLEIPNLIAIRPHLGSLVALSEVNKPHERFLLLGGLTGFLEQMKLYHITPDIEAFTTMLEVIPPTCASEKQLISFVRKIGLKSDIDFFNILMKKRSMRFDYEAAKEVLSMIRTAGLHPDIVTYGVLALGCTTSGASRELLQQMRASGVRMNIQILGAMLRQGCANRSFPYIIEIMQISLDEHIKPNEIFLTHLHKFYIHCARSIDARYPTTKSKSFKYGHAKFCDKLRLYYEEWGLAGLKLEDAIRKIKERPHDQYKETITQGLEPLKNESLARKQKLRKYIKKIKIENLRDSNDNNEIEQKKLA